MPTQRKRLMFESFQKVVDRAANSLFKSSRVLCLALIVAMTVAVAGCAKEEPVDPNIPKIEPGTKQMGPNGSVVPTEPKRR